MRKNARLVAAERYVALGWPLYPVMLGQKRPAWISGQYEHGYKDAKRDAAVFEGGCYNIGLALGPDLVVLDVDVRNGGSRAAVAKRFGQAVLLTARQRSGGGGWHFFYRADRQEVVRHRLIEGLPGCELLGSGYGVVLAPSLHESGRRYHWVRGAAPSQCDLLPLPAAVIAASRPPVSDEVKARIAIKLGDVPKQPELAEGDDLLHSLRSAIGATVEGERNTKLYMAAQEVGKQVTAGRVEQAVAYAALCQVGVELGLRAGEVTHTVRSGLKSRVAGRGISRVITLAEYRQLRLKSGI